MKKYYTSCDDIPVFNFYRIAERQEFAYLDRDYIGYGDYSMSEEDKSSAVEKWEKIQEEYRKLVGSNEHIIYYDIISELLYLTTRRKVVASMLEILSTTRISKDVLLAYSIELKKWGYKLDPNGSLNEQMPKLVKQLKASQNKIGILESQKKDLEKNNNGEKMSLVKQQVKLEQALNRNEINTKTTPMTKWVEMINEVKEINQRLKQKNVK